MTDKIIYTICSYEDEHSDIVNGCVNSSLVTIDRYARFCNADLKIIKDQAFTYRDPVATNEIQIILRNNIFSNSVSNMNG